MIQWRKALREEGWRRYSISPDAAPSDEERAWLLDRRDLILANLEPGERDDLHDRLHGFAFSFGRVRGLDKFAFDAYLHNLVEAVDEYSVEVVARACRSWNKGRFAWANRKFEPEPAEMERACAEVKAALCREAREVETIAEAKVLLPPPAALTEAQRDEVNAEISKRLEALGVVDPLTTRLMRQDAREADVDDRQQVERRQQIARDLESRRRRNEARPEGERLTPPAIGLAPPQASPDSPEATA